MKLYRVESKQNPRPTSLDHNGEIIISRSITIPDFKLEMKEFEVIRETPKSWIIENPRTCKPKVISKTSRKKYAYPKEVDAVRSFQRRKEVQASILEQQLLTTKAELYMIENGHMKLDKSPMEVYIDGLVNKK